MNATIPIQNIYYLLCYAWDVLDRKDLVDIEKENFQNLSDLFAKILIAGTTHLFKKGMDQGYRRFEEETGRLRGKIMIGPSLRSGLLRQARAICAYDELTHNVLHNQILKTTLRRLLRSSDLALSLRQDIELLLKRFPQVDEIPLQTRHFNQIQLTRNNKYYIFLLAICRIVHEQWLATETTGPLRFQDFLRDEDRMRRLFEAFVRNFYKKEAADFLVSAEGIRWQVHTEGPDDQYLPAMRTDVSLVHRTQKKKIVVETKFKQDVLQHFWNVEKVHSDNLYQLFAYLKNLESRGGVDSNCQGVLLYAATDQHPDFYFSLPNHHVHVTALNLNQNWRLIERDLMALLVSPSERV